MLVGTQSVLVSVKIYKRNLNSICTSWFWTQVKNISFFSKSRSNGSTTRMGRKDLDISGIFPPIITPFNPNGTVSYEQLKNNFQKWNTFDFKGYVVLGSNGESVSLTNSEKLELCKSVRELAKPGSLVIGGLGCHSTDETIELCRKAGGEDKSVDAVLIVTPSFYKGSMTDSVLENFYSSIADQSPVPIILYSVPANTGIDLSPELVSNLASHPNIIGLKDSGGDITKISRIINETKDMNFKVLAGSAGFLFPALMMGAVGGVCALANVLGQEVCDLYNHYLKKEYKTCIEMQRKLIVPNALVTRKFGVPGLKKSMDMKGGYFGGPVRGPLLSLPPEQTEILAHEFRKQNYL